MDGVVLVADADAQFRAHVLVAAKGRRVAFEADCLEQALEFTERHAPAVVLLGHGLDGVPSEDACRHLRSLGNRHLILVSVCEQPGPACRQPRQAGFDDCLVKPARVPELRSRLDLWFRLAEAEASCRYLSGEEDVQEMVRRRKAEITAIQDVTVSALAKLADSRDPETGEHLMRMQEYSQLLALELARRGPYVERIDAEFLDDLYRSSPLHDIGKVGIADHILLKPGKLTAEEFETMKEHTVIGANILDTIVYQSPSAGFLAMAAVVARFHHERWDGSGYPAGLVGEEIPLSARIVALADVYDAITSARVYKAAESPETARQIIRQASGQHFDPAVVEAFEAVFEDFKLAQAKINAANPVVVGALALASAG